MLDTLLVFNDWTLFLLRLVFGLIFLAHGLPKLKSLKTTYQNFEMMGFKPGWFWGNVAAFLETLGGILIIVGLWTQPLSLLIAGEMAVTTLWKMKKSQGLVGGYELDLLLAVAGLVLATSGNGLFSLGFLFGF